MLINKPTFDTEKLVRGKVVRVEGANGYIRNCLVRACTPIRLILVTLDEKGHNEELIINIDQVTGGECSIGEPVSGGDKVSFTDVKFLSYLQEQIHQRFLGGYHFSVEGLMEIANDYSKLQEDKEEIFE